jgi:hypothetical protein
MRDELVKNTRTTLTDYEIVALYISSVATFVEVGSKSDITKGEVFVLGKKLFDEAIGTIKETRKKLS